jgi:hypothetical protein
MYTKDEGKKEMSQLTGHAPTPNVFENHFQMLTAPHPEQFQTTKGFVCDASDCPDQYINARVTNFLLTS